MKTISKILILVAAAFTLAGCDDDTSVNSNRPAAPQGVFSITGDHAVYLYWNGPYESDISEYVIYRSNDPVNNYTEVGRRDADPNGSLDLIVYEFVDNSAQNGHTYYYAVSSVNDNGRESDLSAENVYDTPRPEGTALLLDTSVSYVDAGFSLALDSVVSWNSPLCDFWIDQVGGIFFINKGRTGTDFQDMGWRDSLDAVDVAPTDGWVDGSFAELVNGHTYVIWTAEGNYAKIHIEQTGATFVELSWAYQTDTDNPELKIVVKKNVAQAMSSTDTMSKAAYIQVRNTNSR